MAGTPCRRRDSARRREQPLVREKLGPHAPQHRDPREPETNPRRRFRRVPRRVEPVEECRWRGCGRRGGVLRRVDVVTALARYAIVAHSQRQIPEAFRVDDRRNSRRKSGGARDADVADAGFGGDVLACRSPESRRPAAAPRDRRRTETRSRTSRSPPSDRCGGPPSARGARRGRATAAVREFGGLFASLPPRHGFAPFPLRRVRVSRCSTARVGGGGGLGGGAGGTFNAAAYARSAAASARARSRRATSRADAQPAGGPLRFDRGFGGAPAPQTPARGSRCRLAAASASARACRPGTRRRRSARRSASAPCCRS